MRIASDRFAAIALARVRFGPAPVPAYFFAGDRRRRAARLPLIVRAALPADTTRRASDHLRRAETAGKLEFLAILRVIVRIGVLWNRKRGSAISGSRFLKTLRHSIPYRVSTRNFCPRATGSTRWGCTLARRSAPRCIEPLLLRGLSYSFANLSRRRGSRRRASSSAPST